MIDSLFKVDGQFPCPKCEKSYVHLRNLHRHLKNECGIEPSYQCPWCPKKCRYNFTLKSHIYVNYYYRGNIKKKGSDDNVTGSICPQCGRTYRHKTTMVTHIKYECNKEPQFVCKFCGKCIYYPSNFKKHLILKHSYMIA